MAWMMDEYGKLHGHTPAIVTGKPIALEGSLRPRGGDRARVRLHVPRGGAALGLSPADTTFVVQGFGNVGSWAARIMQQLGAKMVAVSDADGAIRSDDGIDANALLRPPRPRAGRSREFRAGGADRPRGPRRGARATSSSRPRSAG